MNWFVGEPAQYISEETRLLCMAAPVKNGTMGNGEGKFSPRANNKNLLGKVNSDKLVNLSRHCTQIISWDICQVGIDNTVNTNIIST